VVAVKAYYDGKAFIPISPIKVATNQSAIITILDDNSASVTDKSWLEFAGTLSDENFKDISEILQSTERIDENEW
jgi:uncharacterized membrane protein YcgQ (UPF0703/DUF1980 family)